MDAPTVANDANTPAAGLGAEDLLDRLQTVLERQMELAQQGRISDVRSLAEDADRLVHEILQTRVLQLPHFQTRREQLKKLYEKLNLNLLALKEAVSENLRHVQMGQKSLAAYRAGI